MNIVIGCPVANRGWVLQRWIDAVRTASLPGSQITFVTTESTDDTEEIIVSNRCNMVRVNTISTRPTPAVDNHIWTPERYRDMAVLRNRLLQYCIDVGATHFFSLDSDIIVQSDTLARLLVTMRLTDADVVAPAVNLHIDQKTPAWNFMQRSSSGVWHRPDPASSLPERPVSVDAVMAAMLIRSSAFHVQWSYSPQGEDLGYAENATKAGLRMVFDPTIQLTHLMRVSA
jgi:GT2 family glycosyltransferase